MASQSYICSGILPRYLQKQYVSSLAKRLAKFSRNLLRFFTGTILLILTKHDILFISYKSLLKNLTLAIWHNLCIYISSFMRNISGIFTHILAYLLLLYWKKRVFLYSFRFHLFGKVVDNVLTKSCVCVCVCARAVRVSRACVACICACAMCSCARTRVYMCG